MIKIAICGKANSGKNTLAKMITKEIRHRSGKSKYDQATVGYIAFADPIKKMVSLMFPSLPKKLLYGSSKFRSEAIPGAFKDGNPLTIRQALIDIGTGLGRSYNDSMWLSVFDNSFKENSNKDIIIVPDLRFENEFNHLRDQGFFIIKIYRDSISIINHASETSQDQIQDNQFNFVLSNNGTKNDLKNEVINIVNKINI